MQLGTRPTCRPIFCHHARPALALPRFRSRAIKILASQMTLHGGHRAYWSLAVEVCVAPFATAFLLTGIARASNLTVPDDFGTIQAALNSQPDTVFVRSGNYPEVPTIFGQVVVVGIPGDPAFERPVLAGLWFLPIPAHFPSFSLRNIEFDGPVYIQNSDVLSFITLANCRIGEGMSDISDFPATAGITLRGCQLYGDALLKTDGPCVIDSCAVQGQLVVGQQDCRLVVTDSEFHGRDSGIAISTIGLGTDIFSASVFRTVVDHYSGGIGLYAISSVDMRDDLVHDCQGGGVGMRAGVVRFIGNTVENNGDIGAYADGHDSLVVVGNTIANNGGTGMVALVTLNGIVLNNVVWGSGREGIHLGADPVADVLLVKNNTSCRNAGSGFLSECSVNWDGRYEFAGNIGYNNAGYGVRWGVPEVSAVGCNDWFGNALGTVAGLPPSSEDFSADPLFCDPPTGDFHLFAGSPLVNRSGCGLVGALGVGCSVTATVVSRFTASRVRDGIQVVWELEGAPTSAAVWLERSETGDEGPWLRPETTHSSDGSAEVELDGSAVPDRAYWYRLMAGGGGPTVVIGQPILVEAQEKLAFRLARVGPSPSRGPVRIEFEASRQAMISLDVFDIQGRLVASPARGLWQAGRHAVEWSGMTQNAPAAGGLYLVRYRYPGGEDARRIVRAP